MHDRCLNLISNGSCALILQNLRSDQAVFLQASGYDSDDSISSSSSRSSRSSRAGKHRTTGSAARAGTGAYRFTALLHKLQKWRVLTTRAVLELDKQVLQDGIVDRLQVKADTGRVSRSSGVLLRYYCTSVFKFDVSITFISSIHSLQDFDMSNSKCLKCT